MPDPLSALSPLENDPLGYHSPSPCPGRRHHSQPLGEYACVRAYVCVYVCICALGTRLAVTSYSAALPWWTR